MDIKNKKGLLENIVQELVTTLLIAGCAVSSLIKGAESKNFPKYSEPVKTERIADNYSQRINEIVNLEFISEINPIQNTNLKDNFSTYQNSIIADKKEVAKEVLSEKEIDNYITKIYKKIKVPSILDKSFVKSIIKLESDGDRYAVNRRTGASGLMQLSSMAWRDVEPNYNFEEHWSDPAKNIEVGVKYLRWLDTYCGSNYPNWNESSTEDRKKIIAAAYNYGIGGLEKEGWNIANTCNETTNYVDSLKISELAINLDSPKSD
jgi:soluble lytic murein transglycosylase-like protein